MRSIGSLADRQQADRFTAFLDSQDISGHVEASGEKWEIWVVDEDHVAAAKSHLAEFVQSPEDPRYAEAISNNKRHKTRQLEAALERRRAEVLSRKMPWERGIPLTTALILASVFVTAMTRFGESSIPFTRAIMMADTVALYRRANESVTVRLEGGDIHWERPAVRGWDAIREIRQGQIWRVLTPMFMHLDPFHILFNMIWLFRLGGYVEHLKGTRYLLVLVIVLNIAANFSELYATGPNFGGMSGVGFGLFGYIWMRSRLVPEDGFQMDSGTVFLFLAWGLICATGAVGPVANAAHFGGLAAGAIIGAWPVASLKNPR